MTETRQILLELEHNTNSLLEMISAFDQEKFNAKPSATAWSAAEVGEHVLKVTVYVNKALKGKTVVSERPYDQKIKVITGAMTDGNARYKAPEMALPGQVTLKQEQITAKLKSERRLLAESVAAMDLTLFVSEFKHPGFGGLTALEWVNFEIQHARRHMEQLKRLAVHASEAR